MRNSNKDLLEMMESFYNCIEYVGGLRKAFGIAQLENMSALELMEVLCTNRVRFTVKPEEKVST